MKEEVLSTTGSLFVYCALNRQSLGSPLLPPSPLFLGFTRATHSLHPPSPSPVHYRPKSFSPAFFQSVIPLPFHTACRGSRSGQWIVLSSLIIGSLSYPLRALLKFSAQPRQWFISRFVVSDSAPSSIILPWFQVLLSLPRRLEYPITTTRHSRKVSSPGTPVHEMMGAG